MRIYLVKYKGPFGYIKPWTAVRDDETFSQQFLTPSIIEGMEKKLFPEMLSHKGIQKIIRHRLRYRSMSKQQEVTQPKGSEIKSKPKEGKIEIKRDRSIINRFVLVEPTLFLAFDNQEDAEIASKQHICLCRNEDLLLPSQDIIETSSEEFDDNNGIYNGFELIFGESEDSFIVGMNRFDSSTAMHGTFKIIGQNPLISEFTHED